MKIPIFDLKAQYENIKAEIDGAIQTCLDTSAFINGEANQTFENQFAEYLQVKEAVGVASGSFAIDLALLAIGVAAGDEVICPSHTFAATAESIVHVGAKPVFVDIDETTYNISAKTIASKISKKTKAIIVVHLYGQMAEMGPIVDLAKKHKLSVIEDAAQAHGALYKGRAAGNWGDLATFSFFPAKNLGAYGDGGAVVGNDSKLIKKIRLLKDHGRVSKYEHKIIGFGERLDNLHAAVLSVKLRYLEAWNQRRRNIAWQYDTAFREKFLIPMTHPDCEHVYYTYTLRHQKRDLIRKKLAEKGISTGVYYPHPLHLQEAFENLKYKKGSLPITEKIAQEIFAIPIYPELTQKQIAYISDTITSVV